jgi:hypothetical protein
MRPELTKRSIERTINWIGLKKLVVVIDGLRNGANQEEIEWRKDTISVVEKLGPSSNIELWVYDNNIGITEHNLRIQERALSNLLDFIWIEEDIDIDFQQFAEVEIDMVNSREPVLLSGYSHFNHSNRLKTGFKGNLFLPLWGLIINHAFHELITKTWRDKRFNETFVERAISQVLPGKTLIQKAHLKSVVSYWKAYSRWGLDSSRRWDSLANYSLWSINRYSLSCNNRMAEDSSYLDFRGMNQRKKPEPAESHAPDYKSKGPLDFCMQCEIRGSRISPNLFRRSHDAIKYRIKSSFSRNQLT